MAKEEAKLETMEAVDLAQFKPEPEPVQEAAIAEQKTPEPKISEEKPKAAKKAAAGFKTIRYIGDNPSYTIGRHRFKKGDVLEVEKELAEYALTKSCFTEA